MLNWYNGNFYREVYSKEQKNKTGYDISAKYNVGRGRATSIRGTCIQIRNKKHKRVSMTMSIRSIIRKTIIYMNFPIFYGGSYKYEIIGFSYRRYVRCSRLSIARY